MKKPIVYDTVEVYGRTHVVCSIYTYRPSYPDPNYRNTGMALCGVLKKGETLDGWIKRTRR